MKINETLNEILLKVFSGANYVSKIALETKKSTPVVFRQLDVLTKFKILQKQRTGKTVTYEIDWPHLSEMIAATLFLDSQRFLKTINEDKELTKLMKKVPKNMLENKTVLQREVRTFFANKTVQETLKNFVERVETTGKTFAEYSKLPFEKSIDLFLDIFGKMTPEKQKQLLGTDAGKLQTFLDFCKLRYRQKQFIDPRNMF